MTDVFSVSSLEEYIKIVERFSPNFSLSRGQGSDLPLFPSALRRDQDGMRFGIAKQLYSHFWKILSSILKCILKEPLLTMKMIG